MSYFYYLSHFILQFKQLKKTEYPIPMDIPFKINKFTLFQLRYTHVTHS